MKRVIVLVTKGKRESVDQAMVVMFRNQTEALKFCKANNTGHTKYWKKSEIIKEGEQIELYQPDYNEDD